MAKLLLDARLRAVLDEVRGEVLADIGCDHGKVTVGALLENRVRLAYAVDVSPASLNKTRRLAMEWGVSPVPVCASGLPDVPRRPDVAVVAGLGGREIVEILRTAPYPVRCWVLVPHQDAPLLRAFLNGRMHVERDNVVEAGGKFYPILVVGQGEPTLYPPAGVYVGLNVPPAPAYPAYLAARKQYLAGVCARLPREHALRREWSYLESL